MIPEEILKRYELLKKELEESITKAEFASIKANEMRLIAQNKDLEMNLFVHKIYLDFGLSKDDRINFETGEILKENNESQENG